MEVKNNHCCYMMDIYADEKNSLIDYMPDGRSYNFILPDDPRGTHQAMYFCPWCGAKLPEDLGDEWARILKEEYNLDNPFEDWNRVPSEFKTDEWWKKRGL